MRSTSCLVLIVALSAVWNLRAPSASAQRASEHVAPAEDARDLFRQGQEAYTRGDYERAAELWERAYALDPRPALQYNLSQAYSRLGRLRDELRALEAFVASGVDDEIRATVEARIETLSERIARSGLRLVGVPEGARISLDGEPHARVDEDTLLQVPAGVYGLRIELEGHRTLVAVVTVGEGEVTRLPVTMHRLASRAPAYVLLATGAGLALGGGALGTVAYVRADGERAGTAEGDRLRAMAISGDVLMGVGAATALTGLIVLVTRSGKTEERALGVAPTFAEGRGGLVIGGRF